VLNRRPTPAFRSALREACGIARNLFLDGLPLARRLDRRLALDIELFSRGGLRVLDRVKAQDYDVFRRRPVISGAGRIWLLLTTMVRVAFRKAA